MAKESAGAAGAVYAAGRRSRGGAGAEDLVLASRWGVLAETAAAAGLGAAALVEFAGGVFTGSAALLADGVRNAACAAEGLPALRARRLRGRPADGRYPSGRGRAEEVAVAGVALALVLLAAAAGGVAVWRLGHPLDARHAAVVAVAVAAGLAAHAGAAVLRIRIGREMGSAILAAKGRRSGVDGVISLAILAGAAGVWRGMGWADGAAGLAAAAAAISGVAVASRDVMARLTDRVDPDLVACLREAAAGVPGVEAVAEVRARWTGRRLHAEVNVAVNPGLSVEEGHDVAKRVAQALRHAAGELDGAVVHVDPAGESGDTFHRMEPWLV
ncbi:MAG: cation diffusion facilitator family transporter [Planctomycetota bacterium]